MEDERLQRETTKKNLAMPGYLPRVRTERKVAPIQVEDDIQVEDVAHMPILERHLSMARGKSFGPTKSTESPRESVGKPSLRSEKQYSSFRKSNGTLEFTRIGSHHDGSKGSKSAQSLQYSSLGSKQENIESKIIYERKFVYQRASVLLGMVLLCIDVYELIMLMQKQYPALHTLSFYCFIFSFIYSNEMGNVEWFLRAIVAGIINSIAVLCKLTVEYAFDAY
ncbi:hypothetical protein EDD86DRAFT_243621 [Gorgonomyces haynaldii]|nr:hypothetical protein EDD86DRAFT_243621 [Gorgonomyces haynaldii]